ncbi:MAG: SNF2-related protein [Candidatus Methylomirabilales bacterium]
MLGQLYVPALAEAVRYDRSCAYFSSSALAAAAQGFARLIERLETLGESAPRPAIRLVVNEELNKADVQALVEARDVSVLEAQLKRRFKRPQEALERDRLAMLAWLVQRGLLAVRVGIMRHSGGIVHTKFGMITDGQNDALVFRGSSNESAQGLVANYDQLEVSGSWNDPEAYRYYTAEFEMLWQDTHPDVHTVTLPEALRLELIKFAPEEPPIIEPAASLQHEKTAMLWQFIREAPYLPSGASACDATAMVDLWPHQQRVVEDGAAAWPEGRLLCDEVGMGKTIEAILILRRLMAGRGVRRALILLPAGLLKQWQTKLREKGGMIFPRLEGINTLVWPDGRMQRVEGPAQALEQECLLLSRETARTEGNLPIVLAAPPWDLVLLDESHAARRRKQEEGEFNSGTLLLTLLRELQLRRRVRGFLLLSATPMQTHPWEPWDLLSVLGEGGEWLAEFRGVREYYGAVGSLRRGPCDLGRARVAARLLVSDGRVGPPPLSRPVDLSDAESVARGLAGASSQERRALAEWLRRESPLARRMYRNTRNTLRTYYERGLLDQPPPRREIEDALFDFQHPAERAVYEAITGYIERRFEELESEKPGKGFVMTIYRRRAASSPYALERSLKRRRDGLRRVAGHLAFSPDLEGEEQLESRDLDDLAGDDLPPRVSVALPTDPRVAQAELIEVEGLTASEISSTRS